MRVLEPNVELESARPAGGGPGGPPGGGGPSGRAVRGRAVRVRPGGGRSGPIGPWFRLRPGRAVLVAGALVLVCAAVGVARTDERTLALALLALPVSLMAVTFGRAGGVAAGALGLVLAGSWSLVGGEVGATGWAAVGTMVVLGALLGEAVDAREASDRRAAWAEAEQGRLHDRLRRQAEAVEVNDLIVQSVAVARWALESGNVERATEVLDEIGEAGQRLVSSLLRETAPLTFDPSLRATPDA